MKIIACYSNKGGVGKTATAVNLAYCSAQSGLKTLICDLDPQGASSFYFQTNPANKAKVQKTYSEAGKITKYIKPTNYQNLDIIPSNLELRDFDILLSKMKKSKQVLRKNFKDVSKSYDVIFLDCPPTISLLSENIFHAANYIVAPFIPTTLSERTYFQLVDLLKEQKISPNKLLPFFSMVQKSKKLHIETIDRLSSEFTFLDTEIPFTSEIEKMGIHEAPIFTYAKYHVASACYQQLWKEIDKKK